MTTRLRRTPAFGVWVFMLALGLPAVSAADDKDKEATERQERSDKDKKLMAEIAAKPEVQKVIERAWVERRYDDVMEAYEINTSALIYENPIVADYVNALGQRLVPGDSPNLYAFRLLHHPLPRAEALSTGTIYVSTGLISTLDNEAQLAYVLAHEIAHVERGHSYQLIRNEFLEEEYAEAKQIQSQKKKSILGALGAVAGAAVGGAIRGRSGIATGAGIGAIAGIVGGEIAAARNRVRLTEWDTVYEDEADEIGLGLVVDQKYDAREVPKTYARLERLVSRDARNGLGFMGSKERTQERSAHIQRLLAGPMKAKLDALLKGGGLMGGGPEFAVLMSALKRDNGILALNYDLFAMAKDNLEEAAALRSSDPGVHYYLGKVVSLTAKTEEERQRASQHFLTAVRYDAQRGSYAEPHLQRAITLMKESNPAARREILDELKAYVTIYQRTHEGHLPANMNILYDYFTLAGDTSWFVPPFSVVQTRYVEWPISAEKVAKPARSSEN